MLLPSKVISAGSRPTLSVTQMFSPSTAAATGLPASAKAGRGRKVKITPKQAARQKTIFTFFGMVLFLPTMYGHVFDTVDQLHDQDCPRVWVQLCVNDLSFG